MNHKKYFLPLVIIGLYFQPIIFHSQNLQSDYEYYNLFDSVVGVGNTAIYNGIEYEKKYRTFRESHEFYVTSEFVKGNVVYDSQPFYNMEMKYDVLDDDVIVQLPNHYNNIVIRLIKDKVSSFYISGDQFVRIENLKNNTDNNLDSGFYQLLYQSKNLTLYKKHKKNRIKKTDKEYVYYVFKDFNDYYLYDNNNYKKIKYKNDIIKMFPKLKKDINLFFKNNNSIYNSNYELFFEKLTKHMDSLIGSHKLFNE